MAKRASMAQRMKEDKAAKTVEPVVQESGKEQATANYVAPSRKNKKGIMLHFSPEAKEQIRRMAFEENTPIQSLGMEAFNLLFASRGLPQIAE